MDVVKHMAHRIATDQAHNHALPCSMACIPRAAYHHTNTPTPTSASQHMRACICTMYALQEHVIRTNTIVCLGKVGPLLTAKTKEKAVLSADMFIYAFIHLFSLAGVTTTTVESHS